MAKWISPLLVLLICSTLPADEVLFTNGDKLTGKVKTVEAGKITIENTVAGTVTVDLSTVRTFSTVEPVAIRMKDGSQLKMPVQSAEHPGQVIAGEQNLALVDVQDINKTDPQTGKPAAKWTGNITVSAIAARGNSNTDSLNIDVEATRRREKDRSSLDAGYRFGRELDDDTGDWDISTDNWFAAGKYDYFFLPKTYWFAMMRVERDNIANLDLRLSPTVGLGRQWVERADFNFNTEAGLGWVWEKYDEDGTDEHFIARLAYHLDRRINDKVSFFHNLEYLPSVEDINDFNINADAGIRADLTEKMFAEFKIEWRHDSEPAPDAEDDDLRYVLGLGLRF